MSEKWPSLEPESPQAALGAVPKSEAVSAEVHGGKQGQEAR